jgi:hypothetical protein
MSTVCEANGAPTRRQGEPPARLRDIPRRVRDQLDVIIERDPSMRSRGETLFRPTVLALLGHGNGATVGAGATLLGPITVGDNALVGAQALVLSDVPPGARVHASTATVVTERPGRTTDGGPLTVRVDGAQR